MNVVGISAFYHDTAGCHLSRVALVAAAQEVRFSRVKHDPRLPLMAFRFCLEKAGLGPTELDAVAFYESPVTKLSRQIWSGPSIRRCLIPRARTRDPVEELNASSGRGR